MRTAEQRFVFFLRQKAICKTQEQLHSAIASLPDKQAKRIYAHFFIGMSKTAIARAEGVSKVSVSESIERGLCSIEKFLKKFL